MNPRPTPRMGVEVLLSVLRERSSLGALSEVQWSALIPAAESARLLPRLAIDAEQLGLTSRLPGWVRDRLTSASVRGREYERVVRWEINRIHRALLPVGLRPVFLKGAAYVAAHLPCGVGRVVADVDILVAEVDIARAEAALKDHGWQFVPLDSYDQRYYRQWMHELPPMRHQERGTMLDVHHRILPRTGRVHPPTARLLEQAVDVGGAAVLAPEHMVLHSAAHLFQDGEVGGALRDLVDLRDLLESLSACGLDRLGAEAQTLGLSRPLYYSVRYARHVGSAVTSIGQAAGVPSALALAAMDRLVERTLIRPRGALTALSTFGLYLRSHWLRMPAGLLLRHLWRKATLRFRTQRARRE